MIPTITFNADLLALFAGILLSLGFSYIPKLNTWFAAKSGEFKRLFMLVLLLLITAGVFGLGCGGIIPINDFACNQATAIYYFYVFIQALIANQTTYAVTPQTLAVKQARSIT